MESKRRNLRRRQMDDLLETANDDDRSRQQRLTAYHALSVCKMRLLGVHEDGLDVAS